MSSRKCNFFHTKKEILVNSQLVSIAGFEEWHKNGQLKSRGKYSNGEIIGKLEKWAIDGKPIY